MKNPDERKMVKHLKLLYQKNKNGVEETNLIRINKRVDQNLSQGKISLAITVARLGISKRIAKYGKLNNQGINQQKLHKQTLQ